MTYILLLILLFTSELAYFRIADHFNIIDKPNQRSSHTSITLRGGGIIVYFGILFYFLIEGLHYPWFFFGLTLISIISFADDIKPQSSKIRLIIHFISLALMFYQWNLFELPWYYTIIALIFCTGVLNAYNFMDGINGITGGYSFVVASALCYINLYQASFVDANFIYFLLIALLVFNFFNFRKKAKCFAGDVGAVSIAFIIVYLLGLLIIKTNDFGYIILLALYGVDAILTIIHRLILKENIFEPHRKHLYQILANELKLPHLLVSTIYMIFQVVVIIGLLYTPYKLIYSVAVVLIMIIVYILFMRKYFHLHRV